MASLFVCKLRAGWQAGFTAPFLLVSLSDVLAGGPRVSFVAKDARYVEDENFQWNIFIPRQLC